MSNNQPCEELDRTHPQSTGNRDCRGEGPAGEWHLERPGGSRAERGGRGV